MKNIISINNTYLLLAISFISFILHNAIYAIFRAEEAVFFLLTLASFGLFVVSIIANLIKYIIKKEPEDIWKLGWLGLIGLLGLVEGAEFFGFFGFFAFLGFKK